MCVCVDGGGGIIIISCSSALLLGVLDLLQVRVGVEEKERRNGAAVEGRGGPRKGARRTTDYGRSTCSGDRRGSFQSISFVRSSVLRDVASRRHRVSRRCSDDVTAGEKRVMRSSLWKPRSLS
jgi:hypothetical protein